MASQAAMRQQARRVALDAQTRMRQRRVEQDRRRGALAVTVVTALTERDAVVRSCEARAGSALRSLTEQEGLSLREAVEWCGGAGQLTVREATRLRKVEQPDGEPPEGEQPTAAAMQPAATAPSAVPSGPPATPPRG